MYFRNPRLNEKVGFNPFMPSVAFTQQKKKTLDFFQLHNITVHITGLKFLNERHVSLCSASSNLWAGGNEV